MTAHHHPSAPSFLGTDKKVNGHSGNLEQFLAGAAQFLSHNALSTTSLTDQVNESNRDSDAQDGSDMVIWKLDLSPESITLDTNIQTIAGLERVLNQLRKHVDPLPQSPSRPTPEQQDHNMTVFSSATAMGLYLSLVTPLPQLDLFRQFNSVQLMQQCVHAFVMSENAVFLDGRRLLRDTGTILSHPAASQTYPLDTLLILSICSLTVRQVVTQNRGALTMATGLMHTYYRHAYLLLQELFDEPHVAIVQSALILSMFPNGHLNLLTTARTHTPLLSIAVRLALAMDMHTLDSEPDASALESTTSLPSPSQPPHRHSEARRQAELEIQKQKLQQSAEKEYRRRLAWMVLCADYFADWNTQGRTGRIDVTEWHVNFPEPLPNEQPSRIQLLTQFCRIVMLRKMHLFRSVCRHALQSTEVQASSLDHVLTESYMTPPELLRIDLDNVPTPMKRQDMDALLLHALYNDTRIAAHIPFLPVACLARLWHERSVREADFHGLLQRLQRASSQRLDTAKLLGPLSWQTSTEPTELPDCPAQLEWHNLTQCVLAASDYTRVMEIQIASDATCFYHSPVHGLVVTAHVYAMLEHCQDPDVSKLCRINLMRTWHVLQRAHAFLTDACIIYLQRILSRWIPSGTHAAQEVLLRNATQIQHTLLRRCQQHNSSPQASAAMSTPSHQEDIDFVKTESA